MATDSRLIEALRGTAEIYGRQLSPGAAAMFLADLSRYTADQVLKALSRCRIDLRTFPTVSDIVSRIDDGRPGAEEAWAMIPKDEESSVVWTEEMQCAYATARALLAEDPIAARMAFRETYVKLVADAKAVNRPARWSPSFGHNKLAREQALHIAVQNGRISVDEAQVLLPDFTRRSGQPALLGGPSEEPSRDALEMLAKIREILKPMPKGVKLENHYAEPTPDELKARREMLRDQLRLIESDPQKETTVGNGRIPVPEEALP